jgi:hypothetical protein
MKCFIVEHINNDGVPRKHEAFDLTYGKLAKGRRGNNSLILPFCTHPGFPPRHFLCPPWYLPWSSFVLSLSRDMVDQTQGCRGIRTKSFGTCKRNRKTDHFYFLFSIEITCCRGPPPQTKSILGEGKRHE